LTPVLEKIVLPMEKSLHGIMFTFRQLTEATLFASDLKYPVIGATTDDVKCNFIYSRVN
jgi:hypothetical protein